MPTPLFPEEDLRKLEQSHESVQRWIRELDPATRKNYLRYMLQFNRTSGKDPDKFLAWAKSVDGYEVADLIVKTFEPLPESVRFNSILAMRSFLKRNGQNTMPKQNLTYAPKDWHRGYRKEEVRKLLGYLDSKLHKLYVLLAVETGFRANTILALRYRHVSEDLEAGISPVAVRLEPKFYKGKKSAGFTFLGDRSIALLKESIKEKLIQTKPDSPLIPQHYTTLFEVVGRAKEKAGVDPRVQPNHGFRKYFENALDKAELDSEVKMVIEGHLAGTRAKHYTGREWEELRPLYLKAYPFIDPESGSPELEQKVNSEIAELQRQLREKDQIIAEIREKGPEAIDWSRVRFSGVSPWKRQQKIWSQDIRSMRRDFENLKTVVSDLVKSKTKKSKK